MSFKHFKQLLSESSTDYSLYTVPTGREFVLFKKRVRNETGSSGSVSFSLNDQSPFESIEFSSSQTIVHAPSTKLLCDAGTTVKASTDALGIIAEVMGVELPAGTWHNIGISNEITIVVTGAEVVGANGTYQLTNETHNGSSVYSNGLYYYFVNLEGKRCIGTSLDDNSAIYIDQNGWRHVSNLLDIPRIIFRRYEPSNSGSSNSESLSISESNADVEDWSGYEFTFTNGEKFFAKQTGSHTEHDVRFNEESGTYSEIVNEFTVPEYSLYMVGTDTLVSSSGSPTYVYERASLGSAEQGSGYGQWVLYAIGDCAEDPTEAQKRGNSAAFLSPEYWSQNNMIYCPPETEYVITVSAISPKSYRVLINGSTIRILQ